MSLRVLGEMQATRRRLSPAMACSRRRCRAVCGHPNTANDSTVFYQMQGCKID
eukprot:GDKH01008681.1.p5 GENE.GDKH01008681.1~~GDKH01008681.1.p5  ORF type:complete len:53 (-),score=1.72 GDKH01008681.1:273-431(-)